MALVVTDDKHYKDIAGTLRSEQGLFDDDVMYLPEEMPAAITELCATFRAENRDAYDNGHSAGYTEGYEDGHLAGWETGKAEGGYDQGYEDGHNEGWEEGWEQGWHESEVYCDENNHEAIRQEGYEQGYEEGSAQGGYDEFWDGYQDNGARDYYTAAFAGPAWGSYAMSLEAKGEVFKPKHPIVLGSSGNAAHYLMFRFNRQAKYTDGKLVDLTEFCKMIDFSNLTQAKNCFQNARAKNITCDLSNCTTLDYTFASGDGGGLDCITLKITEKCTHLSTAFYYASELVRLTFMDGSVISASINLQWSTYLNKASITSVMTHLSTTVTGQAATFSKTAVDNAFATSSGAGDGSTSDEWKALVAGRANWTISLV